MDYRFSDQIIAKAQVTDENNSKFTLTGVNGLTNDATAVMGGLSYLLDIVGWQATQAVRIINQDIVEDTP